MRLYSLHEFIKPEVALQNCKRLTGVAQSCHCQRLSDCHS